MSTLSLAAEKEKQQAAASTKAGKTKQSKCGQRIGGSVTNSVGSAITTNAARHPVSIAVVGHGTPSGRPNSADSLIFPQIA